MGTVNSNDRNGISLKLIPFHDLLLSQSLSSRPPIFINDVAKDLSSGNLTKHLNELLRTHYDDDQLDTKPSCDCRYLVGMAEYDRNNPVICPICHTEVTRNIERPLESQIWMRAPKELPTLIHPQFWMLFDHFFAIKNKSKISWSLLEYLINPYYRPTEELKKPKLLEVSKILDVLSDRGIERGIDNFYRNFDSIMEAVIDHPAIFIKAPGCTKVKDKVDAMKEWKEFQYKYRSVVFAKELPFPSKMLMITESANRVCLVDNNIRNALDAPKTIAAIEASPLKLSKQKVLSQTIRAQKCLVDYYKTYYSKTMAGKNGIGRGLSATRSSWTMRLTICPIIGPHRYDEVHAPWQASVVAYELHLSKVLEERGYTPLEIIAKIDKAIVCGDEEIAEIFEMLIASCPEGGLPLSALRNPTLERLSNEPFYVTKVKTDIYDNSLQVSVLAIKGKNADKLYNLISCIISPLYQKWCGCNSSNCWKMLKPIGLKRNWKRYTEMLTKVRKNSIGYDMLK